MKIRRAVQQCRLAPTAVAQRMGCTPLQFEHRNELPLRLLRMELDQVERTARTARADVYATNLLLEEMRDEHAAKLRREQAKQLQKAAAKEAELAVVKKQLAASERKAHVAHAVAIAAQEAQDAAEVDCKARLCEMREQLDALRVALEVEALRAEAAEKRADVAAEAARAHAAEQRSAETARGAKKEADAPATQQKPRLRITYSRDSDGPDNVT